MGKETENQPLDLYLFYREGVTCLADSWKTTASAVAASDGPSTGGTGVEPSASTSPAEFHLFVSVDESGVKAACFELSPSRVIVGLRAKA